MYHISNVVSRSVKGVSDTRNGRFSRFYTTFLSKIVDSSRASSVALIDSAGALTYGELNNLSNQLAKQIESEHISKSTQTFTTIAAFQPANRQYVISLLAAWKCGKAFLPLCPVHPANELQYFLEDSNAGLILTSHHDTKVVDIQTLGIPTMNTSSAASSLHTASTNISIKGDNALVLYTSGTTGRPKGVMHTHTGVNAMISDVTSAWEYSNHDKILHFLPLHHLHGVLNKLLCSLYAGATIEFMPSAQAKGLWKRLATTSSDASKPLTMFMAVPTVYAKMLEHHRDVAIKGTEDDKASIARAIDTMRKMRLMVSGSAALPDNILHEWKNLTGHTLLERYGMTEIGMALTNSYRGIRKPGFVGKPFASVQCRIIDDDQNIVTKPEVPGELRIKGPTVFKEYLNRQKDTADAFDQEGWFRTGDVAVVDKDSDYRLLGRMSADIIKCSGYKISALEIEREILAHPKILEAAVVGIPDDIQGEKLVAVIVLRKEPGVIWEDKELETYLYTKLGAYKVPRLYVLKDFIERNHLGKVNKKALKVEVIQTLAK